MATATTTTVKNAQVKVAKITQTGNKEMGIEEKNLFYLMVITDKGTTRLNVGEKTYNTINEILK